MGKLRSILWGLVFVVIGAILGLNALGVTDINLFFDGWWALFIIVPCFIGLFDRGDKLGNIIGIIIGAMLILASQGVIGFDMIWKIVLPVALVLVGLAFIFKNTFGKAVDKKILEVSEKDLRSYSAIFSGDRIKFGKKVFKGCSTAAIFGGIDLDLSDAIVKEDIAINVRAIFGGVNIIVPDGVSIEVNSNSVFGGVENKAVNRGKSKATLVINASCFCGGVELK